MVISKPREGALDSTLEEDKIRESFSEKVTEGWGLG
jgi:hypothetical protein